MLGIQLEDKYTEPIRVEVWAEHTEALELFGACSNQWRIVSGIAGAYYQGIDATAVLATMNMLGVKQADQRERLQQLRHIEAGALEVINKK